MAQVIRVSIKGGMPNGEEWSVNPVWAVGGAGGSTITAAQANAIATAMGAVVVPTGLLNLMNGTTQVVAYRVEARSFSGALESQAEFTRSSPAVGSGSTAHPFQTSLVVSLRTGTPGASGRGRMYWPATGAAIDVGTLRLNTTAHSSALSAVKTYLTSLENAIVANVTGAVQLVVWSRKGTGSTSIVNSLQIGNIFDVQRRRRDALIESYSAVSYP